MPPPGVALRCERLVIGVGLSDGAVVLRLAGVLDRESRPALLRVARRVVRCGPGPLVVECAELTALDEAGLDALAALCRFPGVTSVRLRQVDADLGRRIEAAGLAGRLGLGPSPEDATPPPDPRPTPV